MVDETDPVVYEIREHLAAESSQDLDALLTGMTDDCFNLVMCDPSPMYDGPEAVATRYKNLWAALPDLKVNLRRVLAVDGDLAISEHKLSGTHQGLLFGIPPTGKRIEVDTVVVWTLREGRIRGETVYFDLATMLRQVGFLTLPIEESGGSASERSQQE